MKGKYNYYSRKKKKENGDNSSGSGNFNRREDNDKIENKGKKVKKVKIRKGYNNKKKKSRGYFNLSTFYKFISIFVSIVGFIEAVTKTYFFIKTIIMKIKKGKTNKTEVKCTCLTQSKEKDTFNQGKIKSVEHLEVAMSELFPVLKNVVALEKFENIGSEYNIGTLRKIDEKELDELTNKLSREIEIVMKNSINFGNNKNIKIQNIYKNVDAKKMIEKTEVTIGKTRKMNNCDNIEEKVTTKSKIINYEIEKIIKIDQAKNLFAINRYNYTEGCKIRENLNNLKNSNIFCTKVLEQNGFELKTWNNFEKTETGQRGKA